MLAWWPPTLLSSLILENVYNLIYCPHSIQVHHCNEDHLGSHHIPMFFPLQEGDKYVGLEEFKQAVPLLKAPGSLNGKSCIGWGCMLFFFKMQVMRELKNEFIKMIWDIFSHARDRHEAFFVVLVVEPSDKWQRWKDGMVQGCQVIGRVTLQNRNS